jgi:catechol 2,3-dioxygenase-like lactoylglutathione lyase family enzyme
MRPHLTHGGFAIGIEQAQDGNVSPDGPEITLRVDDVDATVERLKSVDVEIEEGPIDQPWQARHAWLRDPDGRRMSIYSTDTPSMAMKSVEEQA